MPAIKKRITAEYQKREQQRSEPNGQSSGSADTGGGLGAGDNSNDEEENKTPLPPPRPTSAKSGGGDAAIKRKAPVGPKLLKGLDAEVLVEKRKRTVPPSESKLDFWLDENFEKKADSHLSLKKLYQFYTELCQQEETTVPELDVFKHMLVNKFGKEFGVKDGSPYSGLLKETKPRKKPVVAASCGYKLKDLIHEALTASGNPAKGMIFSWVKKFIAARYPALQIDVKPQYLRSALQRELTYGRLELVKGIGFCGFYRLPGPPAEEKKDTKGKKQKIKTEKDAVSGEEDGDKSADINSEDSEEEKTEKEKKMTTTDTEESMEETAAKDEDVKEKSEEEKKDKKVAKRKRQPAKPRWTAAPNHSDPQTLNDIFPLAITYMAEPKEASFARIRKYLEKYFDKVDIDNRLKKCMEQGCQQGMWDRVSGSGASGSFQLRVDSFNPNHTESLTDMVCCAIIACTEPKTSSVRLIKNYISDYHPDFNIDSHPFRLKRALERGENLNQIRRISGIGMSGSFQLVDHFFPSPAILAGDSDDEQDEEVDNDGGYEGKGKTEVYVVRQTKSGRKAPVHKTQLDFSPTHKKAARGTSSSKRGASSKRKPAAKKKRATADDSNSEEDVESSASEEEVNSEDEQTVYKPRPSKSRGGGGGGGGGRGAAVAKKPPAKKKASAPSPSKGKKTGKAKGQKGSKVSTLATPPTSAKKGSRKTTPAKMANRRPLPARGKAAEEDEEEEEEEEESEVNTPAVATPKSAKKRPLPGRGKAAEEEEEEEEVYTPAVATPKSTKRRSLPASRKVVEEDEEEEEEEEVYTPKSTKRRSQPTSRKVVEEEEEEEEDDSPPPPLSSRRSAPVIAKKSAPTAARSSRGARVSYREEDDVEDVDDEDDFAPPRKATPSKRGPPSNSARRGAGGRKVEM